jgi:hypothetical protein
VAGKPSVLFYCNGPKIARQAYNLAMVGWTIGANKLAGMGFKDARPSLLPPLTTVEQYLRPSIAAICPDAGGITFETYGSLPSAVPAAGMLLNPATLWLSMPAVRKARAEAMTERDEADLHLVTKALVKYRQNLAAQGKVKP